MRKASLVLVPLLVAVLCMGASAQAPDLKSVGLKVGFLTYLEGGIPFGASFEMPLKSVNPNLTVGGQFMYQGYSTEEVSYGGWYGTAVTKYHWEYTYMLITAFGAYYVDLLKNPKIKTYGKLHLGYNVASAELVSNDATLSSWIPKVEVGGFLYGLNVGAKYSLTPNIAATLELGYGLSIFLLGVEYGF